MTVYAERRRRLLSLARGKQVVAMTAANMFYLTDFWGGGAAIVLPDKTVVVTSPLEADRAEELGKEVELVVAKRWKEVPAALTRRMKKGKGVVDDDSELRATGRFSMDMNLFLQARRVKDAPEIARIGQASRRLDKIFEALPGELRPGRTEWQVAAEVMKMATEQGLTPSGSDSALSPTIVAAGENGALPHSELTSRKIKRGDLVVADIFFRFEGYNSDETRTFAVGTISSEMKKSYSAVLEAQESSMQIARVGTICEDVHLEAVRVLRKHGLAKRLNHSVGHGVGIDIHELPKISKGSKSKLLEGDVITDEPGVYFLGKYGIRIEDTLKIGRKPVPLTRFTKELVTAG
ncbi:MAG: M24 family metallopeptidase [archaeon]|nr:MAG: M24 family metallopeptidase [archaeon]